MTTDIVVVSEASQSAEVLDQCKQTACDVLLLDLTMPGTSGVELLRCLREERPALPILILSMHNEGQIVARALKVGAGGYVTKGSEPEVLFAAIRKIAAGGRFIDPALVDNVVFGIDGIFDFPHDALSKRELQVLKMLAAGSSLGDIAERLHVSPKTISTHKIRLMRKLGIDNNADLIRYAMKHGMSPG
jgi:DNA-binding NarL/FixJ family response regulator